MSIGILALQGGFIEHQDILQRLGADVCQVRQPAHLEGLEGLIIPGGESTTLSRLLSDYKLYEPIKQLATSVPIWGTCAGMVILARNVPDLGYPTIGVLHLTIRRNGYGRQSDSFQTNIDVPTLGADPFPAVFIRAPVIEKVTPKAEILSRLPSDAQHNGQSGRPIAVRQGHIIATSFHPELTEDSRFHRYFLEIVNSNTKDQR